MSISLVGTRNIAGGGMGDFAPLRVALSQAGRALSRAVCRTELSDPMSGYFMIRRTFLDAVVRNLSLTGFKILVDIVASAERPARVAEIPYTFRNRRQGESKLDTLVAFEYVLLLIDKLTNGWLPVTYLTFGMPALYKRTLEVPPTRTGWIVNEVESHSDLWQ
jgi:dolichol-phosphate mannosyltransferase